MGSPASVTFHAEVTLYRSAEAAWHFITLPHAAAARVRFLVGDRKRRGWGSVRVVVTIGTTIWKTSIFPDTASKSFLLPIKAEVRKAEEISAGDRVHVALTIVDV